MHEGEGEGGELGLVPRYWCSVVVGQVGAGFRGKRTSHCDACLVRPLSAQVHQVGDSLGFKGLEFRRDLQYDGSYKIWESSAR